MTSNHDATAFDCGDGVPRLRVVTSEETTASRTDNPRISAGAFAMISTALGQLAILLAVLAGGSPVVGALAGLGLLACGLTLLGAKSLPALAGYDRPAENPFDGPSRLSSSAKQR